MADRQRVDEVERYYKPIEACEKLASALFWVCACLSIGIPYSGLLPFHWMQQTLEVLFMVAVVAHAIISHYSSFFLIPSAENARRKQLLSDAFGIPLTPEATVGYYNNLLAPSVARLGACILENSFFAKSVCAEMAKKGRLRILVYFLLWLAAISCRQTDQGLLLTLTQILFSGDIIVRWVKIEVLRGRNDRIYSALYSHFLHRISPQEPPGIAGILYAFASYESAKAAASVKQSSRIFHEMNPSLSKEWDTIREKLKMDALDADAACAPANSK